VTPESGSRRNTYRGLPSVLPRGSQPLARNRGTGLGLAIVKHVLNRHQARLEIASEPGRGSAFGAVFPPNGS